MDPFALCGSLCVAVHAVTDAHFVGDIAAVAGADAQLAAQVGHIHLQSLGAAFVGVAPDGLDDRPCGYGHL